MFNRAKVDLGGGYIHAQQPGDLIMDEVQATPLTTVGNGTILAGNLIAGCVDRTGPTAAFTDTVDSADNLIATIPVLCAGDSFQFLYRNNTAFAQTLAVGLGGNMVGGNENVAATSVRMYLVTMLSTARSQIFSGVTTSGNPVISGLTASQCALLAPGQGVSGANIAGGSSVIAVNAVLGTVTLNAAASGTGTAAQTFFPQYNIKGMWTASI